MTSNTTAFGTKEEDVGPSTATGTVMRAIGEQQHAMHHYCLLTTVNNDRHKYWYYVTDYEETSKINR